jgi:hypothetical protein
MVPKNLIWFFSYKNSFFSILDKGTWEWEVKNPTSFKRLFGGCKIY